MIRQEPTTRGAHARARLATVVDAARAAGGRRSPLTIAVAAILACAAFAATAAAVVSTSGGQTQISMSNAGEDVATSTTATGWALLANSTVLVTVPKPGAGINARFTAESLCGQASGSTAGTCSVRILANGKELLPKISAVPFAFDSHDSGAAADVESHAIERSAELTPGTYKVQVELKVTPGTKFTVSYWHHAVELSTL